MPREQSYGIVPLQCRKGIWYVFVVQHSSALYWGFPKGHPDGEETPHQAAERELFEETGFHVVRYIACDVFVTNYKYMRKGILYDKSCGYFPAVVTGKRNIQKKEISGAQWLSLDKAVNVLTHNLDKEIVRSLENLL